MRRFVWLAGLAVVLAPATAHAAPITADFTVGGFNAGTSLTFPTAGGFTVTATPGGSGLAVVQNPPVFGGLGVYSANILVDQLQIDGANGGGETLTLSFSGGNGFPVEILSVVLGRVGTNDDALIQIDGRTLFSGDIPGGAALDGLFGGGNSGITFGGSAADRTGTQLVFATLGTNDDFVVRSITFQATPEPATLGVFGLMAVGAGVAARRRIRGDVSAA